MEDLIKALQILLKYENERSPVWCEHDEFHIGIDPETVSEEDIKALDKLSFGPDDHEGFSSFRFGSC